MHDAESLLDEARHWPVRFRKGQVIYDEGDAASAMFRVDQGCVRLQLNGADGRRQIVAFLFPGDHFGCSVGERMSSAEAVTDVALTRYSLQSVLELSARSTEVMVKLIRTGNHLYKDLAHLVAHVSRLPASERVLWFLTWLWRQEQGRQGQAAALPMSRRDIGDFLGLAPETLSRVIKELVADGVLTVHGRRSFTLRQTTIGFAPTQPRSDRDRDGAPVSFGDSAGT